jgi:transposase-like protein
MSSCSASVGTAAEINRRMRPHLKMSGASFRIDETYVKVGKG